FPTLALCYVQAGQRERADSLIGEDSLSAAEADSEMAYRLATDFAVGELIELGTHTITEAEVLAFARKFDPQPFHTDPDAARRSRSCSPSIVRAQACHLRR
ncbi:hypothetical protein B4Q13_23295, partial [Lacticaseibacillus rhamnosus]